MTKNEVIKLKMLLEFMIKGEEEERPDRWVIHSKVFGFTVYGHTLEEARFAFIDAHEALVLSFSNLVELRRFLEWKTAEPQMVHVVMKYDYEGDFLQSIWATEALAETEAKRLSAARHSFDTEEFEVKTTVD